MIPSQIDAPYRSAPDVDAAPGTARCCTEPEVLGYCRLWFERFAPKAVDDRGVNLVPQVRTALATYPWCDERALAARERVIRRCRAWFRKESPTAPLICGGNAKHPMLQMLDRHLDP